LQSNAIIIGGGGGGANRDPGRGASGGGTSGLNNGTNQGPGRTGGSGTQVAGGQGGNGGNSGTALKGGDGVQELYSSGGGGGYFGGGGGGPAGVGGGGSGFIDSNLITSGSFVVEGQTFPSDFSGGGFNNRIDGRFEIIFGSGQQITSFENTITGSNTSSLIISSRTIGTQQIRSIITHPTSCNSPLFTNTVNFNVVDARQIINFEYIPPSGSTATINSINLFNGEFQLNRNPSAGLISFYAPETDINLELDLYARPGFDSGGFRGGDGGYSKVRFTMPRNVEFMIASFNEAGFIVMYRQASVMLVVATGGRAGTGGNGGPGGGVNVAGGNGFGRNAGTGAQLVLPGTLDQNASFGSSWGFSRRITRGRGPDSAGISVAPVPLGGKILNCPTGDFWRRRGISPCQSLGDIQFFTANGTRITNSATISRGFKAANGVRQVGGYQGGGNGARGGNGAADTTAGGGGGSGYHNGSIQVIETGLGGNRGDARIVFRAV
jgi:hypothetical protein